VVAERDEKHSEGESTQKKDHMTLEMGRAERERKDTVDAPACLARDNCDEMARHPLRFLPLSPFLHESLARLGRAVYNHTLTGHNHHHEAAR